MTVVQRLDNVCHVIMGQAPDGTSYNDRGDGLPLLAGPGDFSEGVPRAKKWTSAPTKRCLAGDIVLGIRASIGAKALADREYCLGRGVVGLRPKAGLDARYLWHWLTTIAQELAAKGRGATFKQVNKEDVGELRLALPPIDEQRRVATILDRADSLCAKRRQTLAHVDELAQSVFLDMFADSDARWPRVCVADLVDNDAGGARTGPFGSQLLHSEFVDEGIAVLGIDNVVTNKFTWAKRRYVTHKKYASLSRYTVHPGDVLITIMGTCGRAAIAPDDLPTAINTKHLCCLSLDRRQCLPEYLHSYFLLHPLARKYLSQKAKGAIMSGLNMQIIKALPVALPPLSVQRSYVERKNHLDLGVRRACASQSDELQTLFASLQQRAFAGEL